jgi:predicted TIM-barrel fold metal-dependent hydrolase
MLSRRSFLELAVAAPTLAQTSEDYPVVDLHQHTHYSGRSDEQLLAHQRTMGIGMTVLLPAGSKFGLAAEAYGNDSCVELARRYPKQYVFFANELPDIPETRKVIEKYLKLGAKGIGEQKFHVDSDSKPMRLIADIARHHGVPVLMHFQHDTYNLAIERFENLVKAYPTVNFIGHAQTFWANIDKNCKQDVLYPKGPVTAGGITDRLMSDYPNVWGDLSAGSGLNALLRDEDHARGFLERHQDRLIYGSDCSDSDGQGAKCSGSQQIATVKRLSPNAAATRKMLNGNAVKLLKL